MLVMLGFLGAGRFMHLVVLYGYQGIDTDAEQPALTEQLFDAALGELSVVARGQPCMLVGTSTSLIGALVVVIEGTSW